MAPMVCSIQRAGEEWSSAGKHKKCSNLARWLGVFQDPRAKERENLRNTLEWDRHLKMAALTNISAVLQPEAAWESQPIETESLPEVVLTVLQSCVCV